MTQLLTSKPGTVFTLLIIPPALATIGGCLSQGGLLAAADMIGLPFGRVAEDAPVGEDALTIDGHIGDPSDYRLFELGPTSAGDRWVITPTSTLRLKNFLVIALFDADLNLLARTGTSGNQSLSHVVRHDTPQLLLGVALRSGRGADFRFKGTRVGTEPVPRSAPQVVWLDFTSGQGVQIGAEPPVWFKAFDAAALGQRYAERNQVVKKAIVRVLRDYYDMYNVDIRTSDETDKPSGPHSTIHFGGSHQTRLGSADGVDRYNQNPADNAIIYINNFAHYAAMELDPNDLGRMLGNVAAHELGHLLGLYHTQDDEHLMNDPVDDAWHLAADKRLSAALLEPSVFPTGMENAPQVLLETVGRRSEPASDGSGSGTTQ